MHIQSDKTKEIMKKQNKTTTMPVALNEYFSPKPLENMKGQIQ